MNLMCIRSVYSLIPGIFDLDPKPAPKVGKGAAFKKE
jgi:hypothetical protein